jgi:hypothetical protein
MAWNFSTFKTIIFYFLNLKHVANNEWIFNSCKNSCKNKNLVANVIWMVKEWTCIRWPLSSFMVHLVMSCLNHNLWLDVRCDFIYAIKRTLVLNVGCNYFMVVNWHYSSSATSFLSTHTPTYIPRTYICTYVLLYNLQPTCLVRTTYLPTWVPIRTYM